MALPAQACALIGRFSDPRVAESALTLLPHLKKRGIVQTGDRVVITMGVPIGAGESTNLLKIHKIG